MKRTAVSVLALTLGAFYSIIPLLIYQGFTIGHDIAHHVNWASQVTTGLEEGILYPRWMSRSNGGYGSPTEIFYAPLFHWLTGVVNLYIHSLMISLKIVTFAGFLLSGLSMYIFLRNFCGHAASVVGGIAYQLFPYHLLDLYIRGTLAETFSFGWLPLILHFIYNAYKRDNLRNWIGLSFSYATLIFTHLATAYIFTFVMSAFVLFLSITCKHPRFLFKFIPASILGFAISATYFLPMLFERRYVHIEWLREVSWGDYKKNFLFMSHTDNSQFHQFYVHLEHISVFLALLVICSLRIYYKYNCKNTDRHFKFFSWLFAFSLFFSTPISMPLWRVIPGFSTIQFPWRWLVVSTLASSVLIGLMLDSLVFSDIKRDRLFGAWVTLFAVAFFANIYLSSSYVTIAEPIKKEDMEWILREGANAIEYRPIWLSDKKRDFSQEKAEHVTFREGKGAIDILSWKSQSRLFKVDGAVPSIVRVATFYYPGWTASINGREVTIDIEKDSGAMLLKLPAGKSTVLLEFRDTPLRKTAKWISIISLLITLFTLVATKLKSLRLK